MSLTRRVFGAVVLAAVMPDREARIGGPAQAEGMAALLPPVVGATERMQADPLSGFGLRGFDPVSYFMDAGPAPGRAGLEALWGGVAWRFASLANREAFLRNPDIYAPRLGGHDAEAAARGVVVDAEPRIFAIRSGRLYLFRSRAGRTRFLADATVAAMAEARWLELRRELAQP